ncbi:MAG: CpsD/CapB family tyrosine-protein kinase [bacterium]
MTEQFRKLRRILAARREEQPLRSVLVTSCLPGEGKTTVSINLSAVLASREGSTVILIDADMRRRNLSALLGLKGSSGLAAVLAEETDVERYLVGTDIDGLYVLPAGNPSVNPAELVAADRMKDLLRFLTERYDNAYVIVDSTPLGSTSEPNVLCSMVDAILLVILAESTQRDLVKREIQELDRKKIIGVVLNRAEFETSSYSSYYRYYK